MATYYLSDLSTQFREFQSPVVLNYIANLAGHATPDLQAEFRFLVCGERISRSAVTLAATFPNAEFHVIETDAAFMKSVSALAQEAGVDNVTFHETSLESAESSPLELPELDYVCIHGLLAQLGPVGQEALKQLLGGRLKTGGLAFVSYNAFPGWAPLTPLRALLRNAARQAAGDRSPLELAQQLHQGGSQYFRDVPLASAALELYGSLASEKLLREFLSPNFKPLSFDSVSGDLKEYGLQFVGCHPIHLNYVDISVPKPLRALCNEAPNRASREPLMDFVLSTKVRDDVYIKVPQDAAEPDANKRYELLSKSVVGTTLPLHQLSRTLRFPHATLHFGTHLFESMINYLSLGTYPLEDLGKLPELSMYSPEAIVDSAAMLVAGGQFHPMAHSLGRPSDSTSLRFKIPSRWNREVLMRSLFPSSSEEAEEFPSDEILVSSPVAGNGVMIPYDEAMVLLAVGEVGPEEAAQWALQKRQVQLDQGQVDGSSFISTFQSAAEDFRMSRLYKYYELGFVEES